MFQNFNWSFTIMSNVKFPAWPSPMLECERKPLSPLPLEMTNLPFGKIGSEYFRLGIVTFLNAPLGVKEMHRSSKTRT